MASFFCINNVLAFWASYNIPPVFNERSICDPGASNAGPVFSLNDLGRDNRDNLRSNVVQAGLW